MITYRRNPIGNLCLNFNVFCLWILVLGMVFVQELAASPQFIIDSENHPSATSSGLQTVDSYKRHGDSNLWTPGGNNAAYSLNVTIPQDGFYRVYAWWPQLRDASVTPEAEYNISSMYNQWVVTKNQTDYSGQWVLLGEFEALVI